MNIRICVIMPECLKIIHIEISSFNSIVIAACAIIYTP